jgi:uncharacterized protein (UPF0548 family)
VTGPLRGGPSADSTLNYASIGATQTDEILAYPPAGYRSWQGDQKLGSGDARFETATRDLMTWGLQRGAGIEVADIVAEADGVAYTGIEFGEDGRAIGPSAPVEEELYAADGTPFISAGMTAVLHRKVGPFDVEGPVKVVYVIQELNRIGFAYGTRLGHPMEGEQLQVIEQREDGEVWLTIRSVFRAASASAKIPTALLRLRQKQDNRSLLTALHPTRIGG